MNLCLADVSHEQYNQLLIQEDVFIATVRNYPNCFIHSNGNKTGKKVYVNGMLYANIFNVENFCRYFFFRWKTHHEFLHFRNNNGNPLLFLTSQVLYVIELKFLGLESNAEEELAIIDYRKKQFSKLMAPHGIRVEYICALSSAFKNPIYRDILAYLKSVNCLFSFNGVPAAWLGFGR